MLLILIFIVVTLLTLVLKRPVLTERKWFESVLVQEVKQH